MQFLPSTFLALCLVTLLATLAHSSPINPTSDNTKSKREPTCTDLIVPITFSAYNLNLAGLTLNQLLGNLVGSLVPLAFDVFVQGTYDISMRYCEPEVYIESRQNMLQFLVHGATYTKDYWSGSGPPGQGYNAASNSDYYSWVQYASQNGYPTLAIDRLGNGNSTHPDPVLEAQVPANFEVIHQILTQIRSQNTPLPRPFTQIIYVGHSFGSIIGNGLVSKYPSDVDALILTGYSPSFQLAAPGVVLDSILLPAAIEDPNRFGDLAAAYLEFTSPPGQAALFFHVGDYDVNMFNFDYSHRGVISAGEAASATVSGYNALQYSGPIQVIDGQYDQIFCNPLSLPLGLFTCGTTTSGFTYSTIDEFPAASSFETYILSDAGHCWHLHENAQEGFYAAHDWMYRHGFL